jgi:hypothetical protein
MEKNLVLVVAVGGPILIGRKFGAILKQPRVFNIQKVAENGAVTFSLHPIIFDPSEINVDSLNCHWQTVDNIDVINSYRQSCGEIIIPDTKLQVVQ